MDSSDDGPLVGLAFIFFVIVAIGYVIALVISLIVLAVGVTLAVGIALGIFAGIGIVGNLGLRSLVGVCGDAAEITPQTGRIALGLVFLAPPFLMLFWLLAIAALNSWTNAIAIGLWLTILFVSTPAYYWTYWAREIPRVEIPRLAIAFGPIPLEVPFKTDAVMRAEEQILLTQGRVWIAVQQVRLKLFVMKTRADLKASAARQQWIERS